MMGGFGMGLWLLISVGIVALVAWLLAGPRSASASGGRGALDVLKERYARGEIDEKEFLERKRELEN